MKEDAKTIRRRKRAIAPGKFADERQSPRGVDPIDQAKLHHNGRRIRRNDLEKPVS